MKIASPKGLAVVTGAAGGLGSTFAKNLAARGYRLLLIDRRLGPLEELCVSLTAEFGVGAEPYAADLCNREEVSRLGEHLANRPDLELFINNAGFGNVDYFADTDPAALVGMADLHVVAPTILIRSVLPGMLQRNRGNILNVSSVGAWFHSAGNVQYGATKNFLAVLSQSLQQELRGTNVRVQALCPGFVRTGFHAAEGMQGFQKSPAAHMWMTPDEVVAYALRQMTSKQVIVTPGFWYKIVSRLARMPFVQPIMQRVTWVPRPTPKPVLKPVTEVSAEPAFDSQSPSASPRVLEETAR